MNYLICQDFIKILSNEKQTIELELLESISTLSPPIMGVGKLKLFDTQKQKSKDKFKLICELIDIFSNCELEEVMYSDELINQFMAEYVKDKSFKFDDILISKIKNVLRSPIYEIYNLCSSRIKDKSIAKLRSKNRSIFISKPNEK
jgi:hypothetical protein